MQCNLIGATWLSHASTPSINNCFLKLLSASHLHIPPKQGLVVVAVTVDSLPDKSLAGFNVIIIWRSIHPCDAEKTPSRDDPTIPEYVTLPPP